jgi:hypothetical protein
LSSCAEKYYNYFRDYDPQSGRYLQADPLAIRGLLGKGTPAANLHADADFAELSDVISSHGFVQSGIEFFDKGVGSPLTLYGYANQAPLVNVDPDGLFACSAGDDGGARGSRRRCYQRCQKIYNIARGGCGLIPHPILRTACLVSGMSWHAGCVHRCNTGQPTK